MLNFYGSFFTLIYQTPHYQHAGMCQITSKSKMAMVATLTIVKSSYLSEKLLDFDDIWCTTADAEPDDSHMNKN